MENFRLGNYAFSTFYNLIYLFSTVLTNFRPMDLKFKDSVYFQNEIVPKDAPLVGLAALVPAFVELRHRSGDRPAYPKGTSKAV